MDTRLSKFFFVTWTALQILTCTLAFQARADELCVTMELRNKLKNEHSSSLKALTKKELAEFLQTAPYKNPQPIKSAELSGAVIVELPNGMRAILKKSRPGLGISAGSEVAAFKLDQLFGGKLNVPVTVRRTIDGEEYSLQVWVESARTATIGEKGTQPPYLHFFDYLIDNTDRGGNLLVRPENSTDGLSKSAPEGSKELVGIDHAGAFRNEWLDKMRPPTSKKSNRSSKHSPSQSRDPSLQPSWSQNIRNACRASPGAGALGSPCATAFILSHAPAEADYQQLKTTSESTFRAALETDLSKENIDAFLVRRQEMIKVIDAALEKGFKFPN